MKRKKITALTLMTAGLAVSSVLGGMAISKNVTASAATYSVASSAVFMAAGDATLNTTDVKVDGEDKKVVTLSMPDGSNAFFKRNLAYEWYEGKGDKKNFTMDFAFDALNFKYVVIEMDSTPAWATEEEKATNKVVFSTDGTKLMVAVNPEKVKVKVEEDGKMVEKDEYDMSTAKEIAYTAGEKLTLALASNGNYGEWTANLSNTEIGTLTNIGQKYAKYALNTTHPLEIFVESEGDVKTNVLMYAINGQDFYVNEDNKIEDTVAPALVVNEDIEAFLLGSTFALDYAVVDVLDESTTAVQVEYYQFNPTDVVEDGKDEFDSLKQNSTISLFKSHNFYHTVYKKADDTTTSVIEELGEEYVAIRFIVGDTTHSGKDDAKAKVTYDLAWYMSNAKEGVDMDNDGTNESNLLYIPINKNNAGPTYKVLSPSEDATDAEKQAYKDAIAPFIASLENKAKGVYAGSNAYLYLPSLNWLLDDNNGYSNLQLTISYKSETSSSASTTTGTPSTAKIPVSKEGVYEFKVFATDTAGNPMKAYLDGELVDVTSSNVWDIEEIPYFTFTIENLGLKMSDSSYTSASSRKDTKIKDTTYTLSDLKVIGATNLKEAYALYKVGSFSDYNATVDADRQIKTSTLTAVSDEDIAMSLDLTKVENGDYFALYLKTYAKRLAISAGNSSPSDEQIEDIVKAFERIGEAGDRVNNEDDRYEKYEWSSSSQSFKTVEEGTFIILADYWEGMAPSYRAAAYKAIFVESETATIKGETDWLKNNKTSVILFSIAGFLLIVIVILMMIKPSDESLEDVEVKAEAKKARILAKKENAKEKKSKKKSKK